MDSVADVHVAEPTACDALLSGRNYRVVFGDQCTICEKPVRATSRVLSNTDSHIVYNCGRGIPRFPLTMRVSRTIIETADLDAYPALEREMGWNSEKAQLNRGPGFYRFALLTVGDVSIWRYHASSKLYHDFTTMAETVDLVFFRDSRDIVWCGHELPESSALVHRADHSYWATTPPDRVIYGLYLPRVTARRWDLMPFEFLMAEPTAKNSVLAGDQAEITSLMNTIDTLVDTRPGEFPTEEEAVDAHEHLISNMGRFLESSFEVAGECDLRELPRRSLVDDARDIIENRIEQPLTAQELADELFVSRRVLELAFHDAFGIGPYQFILNQKLHAIRRALLRQEGSVREISDRFGFINAGRLAGMYVRLFGELPSQTAGGTGNL